MSYQILVVDDNETNLSLIARILELEGYAVRLARNSMEAIRAVMQQPPDLAILDVLMPDMDGISLCEKLRSAPFHAHFPIVMLTAMNSQDERILALKAGADDIWSKPFDMDFFCKQVGDLLKGKAPQGQENSQ